MPLQGPPPQPGDLIEFTRTFYLHWGVFVGKGNVVHLTAQTGFSSLSLAFGDTAVVREDPIELVADGCTYRVNNKHDRERRPYPPQQIVKRARREMWKTKNYSLTSANCEHFVTELRYDEAFFYQGCTFKNWNIIEIPDPGHRHWVIYMEDENNVHIRGKIMGNGEVYGIEVYKMYNGEQSPVSKEVESSVLRILGLENGSVDPDVIIRNVVLISREITIAAAKGVKEMGSAVSSTSGNVGSVAAKGVDYAGQGLTAMSDTVGTLAGKGVAAFGNMISTGAQALAPAIAAGADKISAGSGTTVLATAGCIAVLAESLAAQSVGAEEATARNMKQLGSSVSSSSSAVGSAVATGLSWLGWASAAGASSLIGYLNSDAESTY